MTSPRLSDSPRGRAFLYRQALAISGVWFHDPQQIRTPDWCLDHLDRLTSDLVEEAFADTVAAAAYWQPLEFQEFEAQQPEHRTLLRKLEDAFDERLVAAQKTEPASANHPAEPSVWSYLDERWHPQEHWALWADQQALIQLFTSVRRHKWLDAMLAHEREASTWKQPCSSEWWSTPRIAISEEQSGPLVLFDAPVSTTRDIALKWWEYSNGPEDCTVRQVMWSESNDERRHYVIDDMQKWVAFVEH